MRVPECQHFAQLTRNIQQLLTRHLRDTPEVAMASADGGVGLCNSFPNALEQASRTRNLACSLVKIASQKSLVLMLFAHLSFTLSLVQNGALSLVPWSL